MEATEIILNSAAIGVVSIISRVIFNTGLEYRLKTKGYPRKITIDSLPQSVLEANHTRKADKKQISDELRHHLKVFYDTISQDGNFDLANFIANCQTHDFIVTKSLGEIETYGVSAYIDSIKKSLILKEGYNPLTLYHELLHLLSQYDLGDMVACGFRRIKFKNRQQQKVEYDIGIGLNEGYTSYLTYALFKPDKSETIMYPLLLPLISLISIILDEAELKKAYTKADLPYVINGLAKYSSREKSLEIIKKMDWIHNLLYTTKNPILNFKGQQLYKELIVTLIRMYFKKAVLEYEPGDETTGLKYAMHFGYISNLVSNVELQKRSGIPTLPIKTIRALSNELLATIMETVKRAHFSIR